MRDNRSFIDINNVSHTYKTDQTESGIEALSHISTHIEKGSFVVILGRNGSGKSTLAKLINGLLLPSEGVVYVKGIDTKDEKTIWEIRRTTGMVFQNPDNQIIGTIVEEDVAFGPENLGVLPEKIRQRVDEALSVVGLEKNKKDSPHLLSGGQKQRVAVAGILAMRPECIVLDEATSMLDPVGRRELMRVLQKLNKNEGITIVHITHNMDEACVADRVIVIDNGRIVNDGTPKEVFTSVDNIKSLGLDVPQVTELFCELEMSGFILPRGVLTVDEAARILGCKGRKAGDISIRGKESKREKPKIGKRDEERSRKDKTSQEREVAVKVEELFYFYGEGTPFEKKALDNVNLEIKKGEFVGIIGHTGSGKSTLVQHFNGLLKPTKGRVIINGIDTKSKGLKELRRQVGIVFQYPEHQLFEEDVYKDISFGLRKLGLEGKEIAEKVNRSLDIVGLEKDILKKSPFELSGGQKRRVAIAGVLVMEPEIIILDEPAAGLDPRGRNEIFRFIKKLYQTTGITVILVSHNMEEITRLVERVIVMNQGGIETEGSIRDIFQDTERLEELGLSAPQITYLMKKLKSVYPSIDDKVYNVSDAKKEIMKYLHKWVGDKNV